MPDDFSRYAAPAAFLVAATIAILLIRAGMESGAEVEPSPTVLTTPSPTTTRRTTTGATTRRTTPTAPARYTTVERGETLGTIADEFDTTVESLVELNPGVDPSALQVGERIRVR